MSAITPDHIKSIRERTGASMMDCKKALEESNADEDKAIEILRKKGAAKAVNKQDRSAKEGIIASYIHSNKKIGVLLELNAETDFVAQNEHFVSLAHDLAIQVAASNPMSIKPDEISSDFMDNEKEIWKAQLQNEGKPDHIIDKILTAKEAKFREENALLTQAYVKNPEITVEKLITEAIHKLGENIKVKRFARYQI